MVFLLVVTIKNLKRPSLKILDDEFHVAISTIKPDKKLKFLIEILKNILFDSFTQI